MTTKRRMAIRKRPLTAEETTGVPKTHDPALAGRSVLCKYCKDPRTHLPLLKDPGDGTYYHRVCKESPSALERTTGLVLARPKLHLPRRVKPCRT